MIVEQLEPRWRVQLDVAMAIAGLCLVGAFVVKAAEHARAADRARQAQLKEARGVLVSLEDQLDAERREVSELRDELAAKGDLLKGALGRMARGDGTPCPMSDPFCTRTRVTAGPEEVQREPGSEPGSEAGA